MSDYRNRKDRNRNVSVPDFRRENKAKVQSNRPKQKEYRKGTEWDRAPKKEEKKQKVSEKQKSQGWDKDIQIASSYNGRGKVSAEPVAKKNVNSATSKKNSKKRVNPSEKMLQERRKRKKKTWHFIRIALFCVVAILAGNIAGRWHSQINDIFAQKHKSDIDLNEVVVDESKLVSDSEIVNILLVGADKRPNWTQCGRSDCVMVATLDKKHKRLKLTSLMRDMYVEIPKYNSDKFNAAYSYGGIKLLYQTIAYNFGLKLDGYVVVDFDAFQKVIKKLGGVDINLTEAEATYLQTAYHRGPVTKVKAGLHTLNAPQALAYARIRQDAAADFGRTARQRKVMQALFTKAKTKSYSQLLDLAKVIMQDITTDLSNEEIYGMLSDIIMMGTTTIDQQRIPIDNSFEGQRINNQAVLVIDMELNKEKLHEFIYDYDGEEGTTD